jgi:hypothetical protein
LQYFPYVTKSEYDGEETLGEANTKLARHRTREARYTDVHGGKIQEEGTQTWQERL